MDKIHSYLSCAQSADQIHMYHGDLARILGGLPLGIGEIRGNGDDRLRHLVAQIGSASCLSLVRIMAEIS